MPKGSPELKSARREEIIAACENLYQRDIRWRSMTVPTGIFIPAMAATDAA